MGLASLNRIINDKQSVLAIYAIRTRFLIRTKFDSYQKSRSYQKRTVPNFSFRLFGCHNQLVPINVSSVEVK